MQEKLKKDQLDEKVKTSITEEIKTVKDITKYTKYEIQNLRSCGRVSANEIEAKLNAVGIKLAQEEED